MFAERHPVFDWKADQVRPGRRSTVLPVRREDLKAMAQWPRNNDPREVPFHDFPRDEASMEAWFRACARNPLKQAWTVRDEHGAIIGRYGLVLVDAERKEGLLSVRFRADRTGQGYGQDSLPLLLDHWFDALEMETMALDVSILNDRAIHIYEKLGFRLVGYHWVAVPREQAAGVSDSGYVRYLDMQLDREEWLKRRQRG